MAPWMALVGAALLSALWPSASAEPPPIAGEPPPALDSLFPALVLRTRVRRSPEPAGDSVEDAPSHWRPPSATKPQFVTKRDPDAPAYGRSLPDDAASPRFNEIPLPERSPPASVAAAAAYPSRYESPAAYRDYAASRPRPAAPRRVIYYADLPEIPRPRARAYSDPRSYSDPRAYSGRDYDPYGPGSGAQNKYIRDGRYDDRPPYGAYNRDDWYRRSAAPPSPSPSYAIIDADRVQPPARGVYGPGPGAGPLRQYPDPDPASRYYRVPAPYQRNAGPPPPLPPNAPLYDQYRRQPLAPPRVATNRFSEPYRDYNPHQAAPWSMQIGTKLTVKDENRDKQYGPGRRFYVQSQDQGPYRPAAARYDRVEDDPRHRL